MPSTLLNYASLGTSRVRWRWWILLGIGVVMVGFTLLPFGEYTRVENHMDAITGSMMWKTFRLSATSGARLDASPLEKRLKSSGIPWTRRWCLIHDKSY